MNVWTFAGKSFEWILHTSWQAAVLAALVLMVQMIFRNKLSPAWRYGLWLLLVARLLMPVFPQSALSIFNLAKFTSRQQVPAPPGIPVSDMQRRSQLTDNRVSGHPTAARTSVPTVWQPEDVSAAGAALTTGVQLKRPANWLGLACAVWLGGICLLALRVVWTNVRFCSRLARHVPISDPTAIRLVDECATILGIRQHVTVIETEEVESPSVCGLWKKRLLVPGDIFDRFSPEELRHIFLHELAHIKRRDPEVNWLAALLQLLHWFNPVLWLAFARMRADRELATDALALAHIGKTENVRYGETLLKVVESLARCSVQPVLVGIAESKAHLKERFRAIGRRGAAKPWRWAPIGIAATIAGVGLTGAQQNHQPDVNSKLADTDGTVATNIQTSDGVPSAGVLVGPFASGTGRWTLVPDGDFKSGTMTNWKDRCSWLGVFRPSHDGPIESSVLKAGKGHGFAIAQVIAVDPGETYVLSGFLLTAVLSGQLYLDLDDVSFEPHYGFECGVGAPAGVPEWQFVWAQFTVPAGVTNVTVRVVQDGLFPLGDHGYADQVAVTRASDFVPPQTVAPASGNPAVGNLGQMR